VDGDRGLSVLASPDQWARCRHEGTALVADGGATLSWTEPVRRSPAKPRPGQGKAGLVFDRWCRAYRSWPAEGRIDILDPEAMPDGRDDRPGVLRTPRALAIDAAERLYVVESGARAVRVLDLRTHRVRAVVRMTMAEAPVDVAATCCGAVVLTRGPAVLLRLDGGCVKRVSDPVVRPCATDAAEPTRVAVDGGDIFLLWPGADDQAAVVATPDGTEVVRVDDADNLAVTPDGTLVVATGPGGILRRFRRVGAGEWEEIEPLESPAYDGGAVTAGPGGRIAVTTCAGFAWALTVRVGYPRAGRIVGYRLDAATYRTRWGRLLVDACIPPGTAVRAGFLTSDDDEVADPIAWRAAERGSPRVPRPGDTPPLPSEAELAALTRWTTLFRRPPLAGTWAAHPPGSGDRSWATYEAPVVAAPGRYLWLVLELAGTGRATPRVHGVRVERPGHGLLAALPRAWTRHESQADFLQRFLAPAEGVLHELDTQAAGRDALVDPRRAAEPQLGWLAGLIGIDVDERWPAEARRRLLAEAFSLYRIRGTLAFVERLLELYLGIRVPVVERWRLRGFGGATLGATPDALPGGPLPGRPPPWVGGGIATGALGRFVIGGTGASGDAYTATAHRFTVVVPAILSAEQRNVVETLVGNHKPAHALADICEVGSGMRVGRRLHVALTAVVAPGPDRKPAVIDGAELGASVVGEPTSGARIGETSTVGRVLVG
jgi:phage tail-like protein